MLSKSQIKYIQSLSQKKLREEESVFIAEGPKIINELLIAPNITLQQLFATEEWLQSQSSSIKNKWDQHTTAITQEELDRISLLTTPHEVLGIFKKPIFKKPVELTNTITLMLDTIQDPGNLGTIIRCADWFGVRQVICSKDCADIFNPKVVQSTMGSIARVRCMYEDLIPFLKQHSSIPVYATTLEGADLRTVNKIKEGIVVIGNESKGIQPGLLSIATHKIAISSKGRAESLNAAVAAGIILFHLT